MITSIASDDARNCPSGEKASEETERLCFSRIRCCLESSLSNGFQITIGPVNLSDDFFSVMSLNPLCKTYGKYIYTATETTHIKSHQATMKFSGDFLSASILACVFLFVRQAKL